MIRVTVLGSGSSGNAILVRGSESAVLVDAGFGVRALAARLAQAGAAPSDVTSLLLTHEHTDHSCGAVDAARKWRWSLRANAETLVGLTKPPPHGTTVELVHCGATSKFDGWSVDCVSVPHDAAKPMAFALTDDRSGQRVGIVMDLGHTPPGLADALGPLDLLVVESNHDERMLVSGPYPWMLKRRIGGELGHLSNSAAASFIAACVSRRLRGVILAHLSRTNNEPELALTAARTALRRAGWRRDAVWAATQHEPLPAVDVRGEVASNAPQQLALGL